MTFSSILAKPRMVSTKMGPFPFSQTLHRVPAQRNAFNMSLNNIKIMEGLLVARKILTFPRSAARQSLYFDIAVIYIIFIKDLFLYKFLTIIIRHIISFSKQNIHILLFVFFYICLSTYHIILSFFYIYLFT